MFDHWADPVVISLADAWLTEFQIDQILLVLQKGYILYV